MLFLVVFGNTFTASIALPDMNTYDDLSLVDEKGVPTHQLLEVPLQKKLRPPFFHYLFDCLHKYKKVKYQSDTKQIF